MTDNEYQTLQAGDVIELDGTTGVATGNRIGDMPEIEWSDRKGEKGLILSDIFMPQTKIVRKGKML